MATTDRDERILILAPVGRDAELAREALSRAGLTAEIQPDLVETCGHAMAAGVLLLTQEALAGDAIDQLLDTLSKQPPWSDIPLIVLVSRNSPASMVLSARLGVQANATFLERPTGAATLLRAAEMALRARRRQYELRDYLGALAATQEAERHARSLAEEAVRSRDDFLANVAHDLKNPLGAIKGYAQLLQRQISSPRPPQPERLVSQLDRIDGMAGRAIALIDELLDASRLQSGEPLSLHLGAVDLTAMVRRMAAEWQETSPQHRIRLDDAAEEILGVWDAQRLERAIANLIGNAVKYSPRGGTITIRLEQQQGTVSLTVCDEGIGIPAADLPHVFERFYRGGNAAGLAGTGLGLAGVRHIVEQHGGSVGIESDVERGTRVTLWLPYVQDGAS